jgi:hypothetical protein
MQAASKRGLMSFWKFTSRAAGGGRDTAVGSGAAATRRSSIGIRTRDMAIYIQDTDGIDELPAEKQAVRRVTGPPIIC